MKFTFKHKQNPQTTKKYQSGGYFTGDTITTSVYVPYKREKEQPVPFKMLAAPPQADPKRQLKKSLASKDLDIKGLPSDVSAFYSDLNNLQAELEGMSELDIIGNTKKFRSWQGRYNQLINKNRVNTVAKNEERYKKAESLIGSNRFLADSYVTDGNGNLQVIDTEATKKKGQMVLANVSVSDFYKSMKKNPGKYQMLKVNDAMRYRHDNIAFTDKNSLISNIFTTSSVEDISKKASDVIGDIKGGESYKKVISGLDMAMAAGQQFGIDKVMSAGSSNLANIKAAQNYFISALDPNDWAQLKMRVIERSGNADLTDDQIQAGAVAILGEYFKGVRKTSSESERGSSDMITKLRMNIGGGNERLREADEWFLNSLGLGDESKVDFLASNIAASTMATGLRPFKDERRSYGSGDKRVANADLINNSTAYSVVGNQQEGLVTVNGDRIPADQVVVTSNSKGALGYVFKDASGKYITPMNDAKALGDFKSFNNDMKAIHEEAINRYGGDSNMVANYVANKANILKNKYANFRNLTPEKVVFVDAYVPTGNSVYDKALDNLKDEYKEEADSNTAKKFRDLLEYNGILLEDQEDGWFDGGADFYKTTLMRKASTQAAVSTKTEDTSIPRNTLERSGAKKVAPPTNMTNF